MQQYAEATAHTQKALRLPSQSLQAGKALCGRLCSSGVRADAAPGAHPRLDRRRALLRLCGACSALLRWPVLLCCRGLLDRGWKCMPRWLLCADIPLHCQQGLLSLRMVQVENYLHTGYKVELHTHGLAWLAGRVCVKSTQTTKDCIALRRASKLKTEHITFKEGKLNCFACCNPDVM